MNSVTLLVDSFYRSVGIIPNFTMSFDLGINFVPELIKVLQITITSTYVPPQNVVYLCSNIIGGYSNGYYNIAHNLQPSIGNFCVIAVIPITAIGTTTYTIPQTHPYFTCLGTAFGKKNIKNTPKNISFSLIEHPGISADIGDNWTCIIDSKQLALH